jgi:ornithine carbamoyltransferase
MIRTFEQSMVERFADYSNVPVINGLTDLYHPCQLLADLQTYQEIRGDIQGKTVVWVGDGNNMCHSYIEAAKLCDFRLRIACPPEYQPEPDVLASAPAWIEMFHDAEVAVRDADVVVTDTWASMGQEEEHAERLKQFQPFQVNTDLMRLAKPDAIFMHCLPAHRGEEVTDDVLDGPQSVVWQEAENRLHAQKALLELLLL